MVTLAKAFNEFIGRLPPTPSPSQRVSERSARLVRSLQSTWGQDKVLAIGSVSRGTHVPPKRELDWMIVLDPTQLESTDVAKMLTEVEEKLAPAYGDQMFRVQARGVGLSYGDLGLEVVPALPRAGGGYQIPDVVLSKWIDTNPLQHAVLLKERNYVTGGMAVGIVRALKVWNRNANGGLRSFHLEVMTLRGLTAKPESFAAGVRDAFRHIAVAAMSPCDDPAESTTKLDEYLDTAKRREAVKQVCENAANEIEQAIAQEASGAAWPAVDRVRKLLGTPF